ncbi:MAG: hypothetical protein ACO1OQ_05220 [Rufibacter sp.]
MKYFQYIGILLGAIYGYGYRLICEGNRFPDIYNAYNIYSISFIWVLPIVISIIPILIAREEILKSRWKQFAFPFFSVLLFFILSLSSGIEDWLCILIISFPFLITAGIIGLLAGPIIEKRSSKKLYSILLLPFILNPIEPLLPSKTEHFNVESRIIIHRNQKSVWNHIIEVPEIKDTEYNYGFLNWIGVPRPISSKVYTVKGQKIRIGHFSENLNLYESITSIDTLHFVEFKIHLDKSKLRDLPTDKHLLQSDYFHFNRISYRLNKLDDNQTELILNCEYRLNSRMNGYANFWAKTIIKDFESRLLNSLKLKLSNKS